MTSKKDYCFRPRYHVLEDRLWSESPLPIRSEELTVISIDRYFGPRKPEQLTPHSYWEMGCVVRGQIELICKEKINLLAGSVFVIPPNVPHAERSNDPADIIWLSLRGSQLPANLLKTPEIVRNHDLARLIEQLWIFSEIGEIGCGPELDAKVRTIVTRFFSFTVFQRGNIPKAADMVERSIAYLNARLSDKISIPDVALEMGCSQTYFRRLFKMRTGRTPVTYLEEIRIRHAQSLLEHMDMSIAEISRSVGYDDPFYFSRIFTKISGVNPTTYRAKTKKLINILK